MNSDGSNVNQPPPEFEAVIENPSVACTTKRFLDLDKDCHLMWKHHSGKQPNKPCVFPFTYNGHKYKECLSKRGEDPWCSTLVDYSGAFDGGRVPFFCQIAKHSMFAKYQRILYLSGKHQKGNWGDCGSGCPIKTAVPGTQRHLHNV